MLTIFRGLVLLLLSVMGMAHAADTGWLVSPQNDHARVRFQAERDHDRIKGLLTVELQQGWKTYWRSPGEGGVAPQITWQGETQAEWFWPAPSRFDISGLTTQGYHHKVMIPLAITARQNEVLDGTLTLSTCSNVCLLTDYQLHLDFNQPVDETFQARFDDALRHIPPKKGLSDDLAAHLEGDRLIITGTRSQGWTAPGAYFDPLEGDVLPGEPTFRIEGQRLTISTPVTDEWGDKPATLAGKTLSFVLTDGDTAQETELVLDADRASAAPAPAVSLVKMLLFAFMGGFILNLMPCVLPVMGMKLSSVLHAGSDKGKIRLRFLATSAGILTSFALLALMLTGLKLTGASLGWGIQFQNPWFIGLMVAVTFIFAMNLFGAFEFLLPSSATGRMATAGGRGVAGSFCEGVFATLLATPCSAPFLGTAVAFALAASLPDLWLIFGTLGLGMSAPWLLVALIPRMATLLPRPGRWMNTLKMVLGLMMLISSLWLATLLNLHLGERAGGLLSLVIVILAIAVIVVSRPSTRLLWPVVMLLAAFGGYQVNDLLRPHASPLTPEGATAQRIQWQPLSEEAITLALADGKRVFVDITADWCVTCKVNELRVLRQPEVVAALSEPDVIALRGDWSQPSDTIAAFLQKRKRYAIPFTEVYGPGLSDGVTLSPLLDQKSVLNALNNAKG